MSLWPEYRHAPSVWRQEVIVCEYTEGDGTPENPSRRVTDFRGMDGAFLARRDEWLERRLAEIAPIETASL